MSISLIKFISEKIITTAEETGIRVDYFIARYFESHPISDDNITFTRTKIQEFINNGNILVNEVIVKPAYKLKENDVIYIRIPVKFGSHLELRPEYIYFDLVYIDKDIIVINKPQGLVVHPAHGHTSHTLINGVLYLFPEVQKNKNILRAGLVHRLDKDTSGLILLARNEMAQLNLSMQFKQRIVKKEYIAIVYGLLENKEGEINTRIGRNPIERKKMSVLVTDGKEAITYYKVIKYLKNCTFVKLSPHTGRTHQLRVHMAYLKHPIVGDTIYSRNKTKFHNLGLMLCSKKIKFLHPRTEKEMEFEVDIPERFNIILNKGVI